MSKSNPDSLDEVLKIYSNEDDRIQQLGQVLSTPTSRKIFQLLVENQLHAKEIGKLISGTENPRLPNLIHHLDKMTKIGLLKTEKKLQRKNGHVLKYYKAIPMVLIVPEKNIEKVKSNSMLKHVLKSIFKDGLTFCLVGVAGLVSFLISNTVNENKWNNPYQTQSDPTLISIIISLLVIISGLVIYIVIKKKKR